MFSVTDRCISFFSKFQIVLTSESEYLSFISFSNLPKSLFIFSQFALEYLNIFLGFGWHLLKEVIHSIILYKQCHGQQCFYFIYCCWVIC